MTTKTKTTKPTSTARNAKKATKRQNQGQQDERTRGQTRRQGIETGRQEDQPARSRDNRAGQIEGRHELQSDGRGDAGRRPLNTAPAFARVLPSYRLNRTPNKRLFVE